MGKNGFQIETAIIKQAGVRQAIVFVTFGWKRRLMSTGPAWSDADVLKKSTFAIENEHYKSLQVRN